MPILRTSNDKTPGVRTFQMPSDSDPTTWYLIKRVRRFHKNRWLCSCPDWMNRRMLANTHCKHIRRIRAYAITLGGISKIPRGQEIEVKIWPVVLPKPSRSARS